MSKFNFVKNSLYCFAAILLFASVQVNAQAIKNGTSGNDRLVGTAGADDLRGFAGSDVLIGRGGDDFIYGGPGGDVIKPGNGNDVVFGGDRAITSVLESLDTIHMSKGNDKIETQYYARTNLIRFPNDGGDLVRLNAVDERDTTFHCRNGLFISYIDLRNVEYYSENYQGSFLTRHTRMDIRFSDGTLVRIIPGRHRPGKFLDSPYAQMRYKRILLGRYDLPVQISANCMQGKSIENYFNTYIGNLRDKPKLLRIRKK